MHVFIPYRLTLVDKDGNPADIFYAESGAAGFDIKSDEEVALSFGERAVVKTGLFVKKIYSENEFPEPNAIELIPEIQIRPRSGLAVQNGITVLNAPGTIDSSYEQEIMVILHNTSNLFGVKLFKGQRIAQGVQALTLRCPGVLVKDAIRNGGFGSTGK